MLTAARLRHRNQVCRNVQTDDCRLRPAARHRQRKLSRAAAHIQNGIAGQCRYAVQQAFVEASAFQCGFCTPGFILMTRQLLDEHPDPDDDTIKHYLSGNLCRCAAYPEIIEAVKLAARKRRKS